MTTSMAASEKRAADASDIALTISPSKKKNGSGVFRVVDHWFKGAPFKRIPLLEGNNPQHLTPHTEFGRGEELT
jgi:hypothetical protein